MSELTILSIPFVLQPLANLRDGPAEIRWWYNRAFLDSNGIQVQWGSGTTGLWITTPCSVASGLILVDQDTLLWTTDDAQDPSPASITLSAGIYSSRGTLIQSLQISGRAQWVVPSSLAPTTTWENFSAYNQAVALANPPQVFYTASAVDALVDRAFDEHPASDSTLGTVFASIAPSVPGTPVAWITDDPLVRDAILIQGIEVSVSAPSDGQVLTYIQSNNDWEPSNAAPGTGNVVSNEVISVDGEVTFFSGTGGKTIRRGAITGIAVYTPSLTPASVLAATSAEEAFVVAGLTTADKVIVNGPAVTAGTGIVNARVSGADTLALTFINATGGPLTPVAGTYTVIAIRS